MKHESSHFTRGGTNLVCGNLSILVHFRAFCACRAAFVFLAISELCVARGTQYLNMRHTMPYGRGGWRARLPIGSSG